MADSSAVLQDAKDVTLQRIHGDKQMCDGITNRKQVNLSVCFRSLVHSAVCKEQNTSSDIQPFMAEEKDIRKSRYLDKTKKYIATKQRQRIMSRSFESKNDKGLISELA